MGQRLVIEVKANNKILAAIYYHWSAYTASSLMEARDLIDGTYPFMTDDTLSDEEKQLKLIDYVYETGGCIDGGKGSREYCYIFKKFKKEFGANGSRNNGLIAISEHGMEALKSWEEGNILIDFDNRIIDNSVFFMQPLETWKELYEEYDDDLEEKMKSMEDVPIDLETIRFNELDDTIHWTTEQVRNGKFDFFYDDDAVLTFIA